MPDSEKEYLLLLWEENICPTGGNTIPKGTRVGSGSKSDGGFYGLECYAKYYEAELWEMNKNLRRLLNQNRNN